MKTDIYQRAREIRKETDIVSMIGRHLSKLTTAGNGFKACCPFHKGNIQTFTIHPDMGFWHCFECGEHGDIIVFTMKINNLNFEDAIDFLG